MDLQSKLEQANGLQKSSDKGEQKKAKKEHNRLSSKLKEEKESLKKTTELIESVETSSELLELAQAHPDIGTDVQLETAKLHEGDEENVDLWHEFLPHCRDEIDRIYDRLGVEFDHWLGESFYHPMLADTVDSLMENGMAEKSAKAICVFLDEYEAPMIIRKADGAFLYATTDLATIKYRMQQWKPDIILYVVDHRQGEHFSKLFSVADKLGYDDLELHHVSFGTVMGEDGKPFKTRDGDTVGLEGLLNDAVAKAHDVVKANSQNIEFTDDEMHNVANAVGLGALKYADLSNNRSSDYKFSYEKMLALVGNTAPYLQYSYARVQGIFRKGNVDIESLRSSVDKIVLETNQERKLALELLRFEEALEAVVVDFRPNLLTDYLYGLAKSFMSFFEACPVNQAENDELRNGRFLLCDLTARTIKTGLTLLGIDVAERM